MHTIVIGGSAGAIKSLREITSNLPKDLDAALFVVIHFPSDKKSELPKIISNRSSWKAVHATHDQKIERGKIYVAPPGYHLLIEKGKTELGKGPSENRFRPSIDVLFRSAAVNYGSQVTGIILSGILDDGTAGLSAIKKRGGTAIIQDPDDAEFSAMPLNALKKVGADYCVPAEAIAPLLSKLVIPQPVHQKLNVMKNEDGLEWENNLAKATNSSFEDLQKFATPSRYICPECEGPIFRMKDDTLVRYRCFVGHGFSEEILLSEMTKKINHLLWTTFRTVDEKREMIENLSHHSETVQKEKEKISHLLNSIKSLLEINTIENIESK